MYGASDQKSDKLSAQNVHPNWEWIFDVEEYVEYIVRAAISNYLPIFFSNGIYNWYYITFSMSTKP